MSDMHRVLLIYPPYERFRGASSALFPIGLGYLATQLDRNGYHARIYNADLGKKEMQGLEKRDILSRTLKQVDYEKNAQDENHYVWGEIRQIISDFKPDMVGLYTVTLAYPVVLRTLRMVKMLFPRCVTILGGPHVTVLPDDVMRHPEVDYVLIGEADRTLPELVDMLKEGADYTSIMGLGYRKDGEVVINHEYDYIENIDALPIVNRELVLNKDDYPGTEIGRMLVGSRGCPFNCTFCASPAIWKRRVRYNSPERLIKELKYLKKTFDIQEFAFDDDTFTALKKNTIRLCEGLIEADLRCKWTCLSRADALDEELLTLMKSSGCDMVHVGVESGSDHVLKKMKKRITKEQVRCASEMIRSMGMRFQTFFMVGTPYERVEDIRETIDFMQELKCDRVHLCTFTPNPGTQAHRDVVEAGMFDPDFDWATNYKIGHHSFANHFTPHISKDEFVALAREATEVARNISVLSWSRRLKSYRERKGYYLTHPGYVVSRLATMIKLSLLPK